MYSCAVCDKSFHLVDHLTRHLISHTDEKPFTFDLTLDDDFENQKDRETVRSWHNPIRDSSANSLSDSHASSEVNTIQDVTSCYPIISDIRSSSDVSRTNGIVDDVTAKRDRKRKKGDLECDMCQKTFRDNWQFNRHYRTHTGEKPFACPQCKRGFANYANMTAHREIHDREKKCAFCPCTFSTLRSLKKHEMKHTSCLICDETLPTFDLLKEHISAVHDNRSNPPEQFQNCVLELSSTDTDEEGGENSGEVSEKGEDNVPEITTPVEDLQTDVSSSNSNLAETPVLVTIPDEISESIQISAESARNISCEVCQKSFRDRWALKEHYRVHTGEKPYQCPVCKRRFSTHWNMIQHSDIHVEKRTRKCEYCEKTFETPRSLRTHEEMYHGGMFCCSECNRRFPNYRVYKQHVDACNRATSPGTTLGETSSNERGNERMPGLQANHQLPNPDYAKDDETQVLFTIPDEIISESVQVSAESELDKSREMLSPKKVNCEVCQKSFRDRWVLKEHYRVHTGEKPYQCPVCKRRFSSHWNMVQHSDIHVGNRTRKCEYCEKTFETQRSLKKHEETHRPNVFGCSGCNRRFPNYRRYKQHVDACNRATSPGTTRCVMLSNERRIERMPNTHVLQANHQLPNPDYAKDNGASVVIMESICAEGPVRFETMFTHLDKLEERKITVVPNMCRQVETELAYQCRFCTQTFVSSSDLDDHEKNHEKESVDICEPSVGIYFLRPNAASNHGADSTLSNYELESNNQGSYETKNNQPAKYSLLGDGCELESSVAEIESILPDDGPRGEENCHKLLTADVKQEIIFLDSDSGEEETTDDYRRDLPVVSENLHASGVN